MRLVEKQILYKCILYPAIVLNFSDVNYFNFGWLSLYKTMSSIREQIYILAFDLFLSFIESSNNPINTFFILTVFWFFNTSFWISEPLCLSWHYTSGLNCCIVFLSYNSNICAQVNRPSEYNNAWFGQSFYVLVTVVIMNVAKNSFLFFFVMGHFILFLRKICFCSFLSSSLS